MESSTSSALACSFFEVLSLLVLEDASCLAAKPSPRERPLRTGRDFPTSESTGHPNTHSLEPRLVPHEFDRMGLLAGNFDRPGLIDTKGAP